MESSVKNLLVDFRDIYFLKFCENTKMGGPVFFDLLFYFRY